jgi:hypothetical protein
MTTNHPTIKHHTLVLPTEFYNELQRLAEQRCITVIELLRKFIKLGLLASLIENSPGAGLFLREGNTERQLIL